VTDFDIAEKPDPSRCGWCGNTLPWFAVATEIESATVKEPVWLSTLAESDA
jgi:hypothetical protein